MARTGPQLQDQQKVTSVPLSSLQGPKPAEQPPEEAQTTERPTVSTLTPRRLTPSQLTTHHP
ncbi:hypothetical protein PGT21_001383 [Puccinia graminis f. sp. tritici]|uniref:Uncharacterized protein n=1 Tax=Puccinia graminis f. sp. tritici TaxID=56615 RepID=A0A5B0MSY0_PUCGR|nr:hypothetical protein PGT21_001383 [Puccinia graminis f. sp. tritici]